MFLAMYRRGTIKCALVVDMFVSLNLKSAIVERRDIIQLCLKHPLR